MGLSGYEGTWWGNVRMPMLLLLILPLLHSYTLNPPWKVDRVLANQSLLLTAGTPSNIPFAWFLVLGCNRQAWVSIANSAWWWKSDTRGKQGKGMVEGREGLGVTSES